LENIPDKLFAISMENSAVDVNQEKLHRKDGGGSATA
jgi:hypothetical protein